MFIEKRCTNPQTANVLPKSASDFRCIPTLICLAEILCPIPHRHHNRLLIHIELFTFIELQTPFPSISESIRPFARIAIFLVPDKIPLSITIPAFSFQVSTRSHKYAVLR